MAKHRICIIEGDGIGHEVIPAAVRVLEATGGVVEGTHGAARILGINPSTLRSRMKKLGIPPPRTAS